MITQSIIIDNNDDKSEDTKDTKDEEMKEEKGLFEKVFENLQETFKNEIGAVENEEENKNKIEN